MLAAGGELGPWFLALLLMGLFFVYAAEKLGGKDGPITRTLNAISNRELNKIRRDGEIEAERQRLAALTESEAVRRLRGRLAEAYTEIDELETTVEWLLRDRNDQRRRDRLRGEFDRELVEWLDQVLAIAQKGGLVVPTPPRPPELERLLVLTEDLPDEAPPPTRTRSSVRRRRLLDDGEDEDGAEGGVPRGRRGGPSTLPQPVAVRRRPPAPP